MQQDKTEEAIAFMDQLYRLGEQLQAAQNQQKFIIARMLELKKIQQTDTEEYAALNNRSTALQEMIDHWRPVYLERLQMVKDVQGASSHGHSRRWHCDR